MTESIAPLLLSPQNQEALEELVWAIDSGDRQFSLILVRCNYSHLRQQLLAELQQRRLNHLVVVSLAPETSALLTRIQTDLAAVDRETVSALMVVGLETVVDLDCLLSSTNQVREEFRQHCPFPLILWVTDAVLTRLMQLAPDFENWATVTEFTLAPDILLPVLRQAADRLFETLFTPNARLSFEVLHQDLDLGFLQRSEVPFAIQDLQRQGKTLEADVQASLELGQGLDASSPTSALPHFERSLAYWQLAQTETTDPAITAHLQLREALLLFFVGSCRYALAEQERQHSTDWQAVREPLQRCIEIFEQQQRPGLVAKCITQLERVLQQLRDWDALEVVAQKSRQVHHQYGSRNRLAQDYGFLAKVALERGQWAAARQAAEEALAIMEKLPEDRRQLQGLYLLFLAQALFPLGEQEAAIAALQQARSLGDQGRPKVHLSILEMLGECYLEQQNYLAAFQIKQERVSIEHQYGIRAFVGAGRLQPQRASLSSNDAPIPPVMVAAEITTAGRQQDLERLIERIGRHDYRLIVIHGNSGVGKSSLVNAGLVPALRDRAIGTRDNLPVVLRRYTNWTWDLWQGLSEGLSDDQITTFLSDQIPQRTPALAISALLQLLQRLDRGNQRTILVFDQFEEFFFTYPNPDDRQVFLRFLAQCLQILSIKVVLSLRDDYLHLLLELGRLGEFSETGIDVLSRNVLYELGNFAVADAHAVIANLTQRSQFYLESHLIDQIVTDLAGEMGQVRPIELQLVGAQIQADNITQIVQYRALGERPKEELIRRYLAEVVADCGYEHQALAELVLYLLTDEKGTRPLKTRSELEKEVQVWLPHLCYAEPLELVLTILVASGLVLMLPEIPEDRYQLVHDYLAAFIRQQQEPKLTELMQELERERSLRNETEEELRQTVEQLKIALENSEILNESLSAEALLASNLELDALLKAVKLGQRLQQSQQVSPDMRMRAIAAIRKVVYGVREWNRLKGHGGSVWSISVSPNGRFIASGGIDGTIKLWSIEGQELRTLKAHTGCVLYVCFSPDNKILASSGEDKLIKFWSLEGQELRILTGHQRSVWSIAFSPDGQTLASSSADNTVRLWHRSGKPLAILSGHRGTVWSVCFSPGGKALLSGSADNTVKLWNLVRETNASELGRSQKTFSGYRRSIRSVRFSPDGTILAFGCADHTIKLWSRDGKEILTLKGHQGAVLTVRFSPDGNLLASGGEDGLIKLWNLAGGSIAPDFGQELVTLRGHSASVLSLRFSPDSNLLVSSSKDESIRVWRLNARSSVHLTGHTGSIWSLCFSPNGQQLLSTGEDRSLRLWSLNGELLQTLKGHRGNIWKACYSPNGAWLASASEDKTVKLWSAQGKEQGTFEGHRASVISLAFSPDSQVLASGSADNTIKLWNLDGRELATLKGHSGSVGNVCFSPDGTLLASSSADHTIRLWTIDGRLQRTLKTGGSLLWSLCFSPDGQWLVAGTANNAIRLWHLDRRQVKVLKGHGGVVYSVVFSPDGSLLASGSADHTVKLWSLEGRELYSLTGHQDSVLTVQFSPDGRTLASAGADHQGILWDFDLDHLLAAGSEWLQTYLHSNLDITP